jgi:hypothetical protein
MRYGLVVVGIVVSVATATATAAAAPLGRSYGTVLVPPPIPAPWSGAPRGRFGLTVAESTLTGLPEAHDAPATEASSWIARATLELALRIGLGHDAELRFPVELAFPAGALESNAAGFVRPGPVGGAAGVGFAVAPRLGRGFRLGVLFEMFMAWVPDDIVVLCAAECEPGSFAESSGIDLGVLLRGEVLLGWERDGWRLFGAVSVRNQPGGIEEPSGEVASPPRNVPFGTAYMTFTLGCDLQLVDGLAFFVAVHQPVALGADGTLHAPILTGGLDGWIPVP